MNVRLVPPIAPGSPFFGWEPPDIHHCEANLPAWIAAPADTWSNLAYVLAAFWLRRVAARERAGRSRAMAPIALAVGLTSFVFHAAYAYAFQILDYVGMFVYICWVLAFGLKRLGLVAERSFGTAYGGLVVGSTAVLLVFHRVGGPVQAVFGVLVAAALAVEGWLYRHGREKISWRPLAATAGLFILGQVFWHFDHADFFCRPDDHVVQGHAIWHLITSFCFVASYRFYRQFDGVRP